MARQSTGRSSSGRQSSGLSLAGADVPGAQNTTYLQFAPLIDKSNTVPIQKQWPSIDEIRNLDDAQLSKIVLSFGLHGQYAQRIAENMGRLRTVTARPGTPEWQRQMDRMFEGASHGELIGAARTAYREYQWLEFARTGTTEWAFIGEADERSCDGCLGVMGIEGTRAELEAAGAVPGSHECGANCRCQLVALS